MIRTHLFYLISLFLSLSILPGTVHAANRTFTLTGFNPDYPYLNNVPISRSTPTGAASVGVAFQNTYDLHMFIWNATLYRYCESPSGVCIGYWRKNYRGILTGWSLNFDDDEVFFPDDPCCSVAGSWSVQTIDGADYLSNSDVSTYQMCAVDPDGTGALGYSVGYGVGEGLVCTWGTTLRISYDY